MCGLMRSLFVSLLQITITEWWLKPIKFFMRHVVKVPKFQNWLITLSMITMSGLVVVNKKHADHLINCYFVVFEMHLVSGILPNLFLDQQKLTTMKGRVSLMMITSINHLRCIFKISQRILQPFLFTFILFLLIQLLSV